MFGSDPYIPDNWNFNASNPCLHVGGNYSQSLNHGLFYVNYNGVSNVSANIGSRLQGLANSRKQAGSLYPYIARKAAHPLVKIGRQDMC